MTFSVRSGSSRRSKQRGMLSVSPAVLIPATGNATFNQGWNPSDKNSLITLSNSNKTADGTGSSGAYPGVRAVSSKAAGVLYYEIGMSAGYLFSNASVYYAGIASSASVLIGAQPIFSALGGVWAITRFNSQWGTDSAGYSGASGPDFNTNGAHTLGLKADFSTRSLTFYKDGTSMGSLVWSSGAAAMFPIAYFELTSGSTSGLTLRTLASEFVQSIPSGATPWDV